MDVVAISRRGAARFGLSVFAAVAALFALMAAVPPPAALAQDAARTITIASTTSTEQSGLFKHLLPAFKAATGIEARVVAVGTGQALDIGRRGDADVLLVHDREAELKFVAEGFGVERREVMSNDFVIAGPRADPARVRGSKDVVTALRAIAAAKSPFVSRGDRSGTHAAELRSWKEAGLDPAASRAAWYREVGQGMGPALNTAAAMGAYVLADRGTWLAFRNRAELVLAVEGDRRLFNQYGVMLVNPARHSHVKREAGMRFVEWITSAAGQQAIADYKVDGEPLFFPNHGKTSSLAQAPWPASAAGAADVHRALQGRCRDLPARRAVPSGCETT